MIPLCLEEGIGVIPWSPLGRGLLAGKQRERTIRARTDTYGKTLYGDEIKEADSRVIDALETLATERGTSPAHLALAWLMQKAGVTAPIIGASKSLHIEDAVAAVSSRLSAGEVALLEGPYQPHAVTGI